MKKILFVSLTAIFACFGANASDGGVYMETQRYESNKYYGTAEYARAPRTSARRVIVGRRPCAATSAATNAAPAVAIKTHTEVIEHYQMYQPVVEYIPVGTYTTRREITRPCCGCNG